MQKLFFRNCCHVENSLQGQCYRETLSVNKVLHLKKQIVSWRDKNDNLGISSTSKTDKNVKRVEERRRVIGDHEQLSEIFDFDLANFIIWVSVETVAAKFMLWDLEELKKDLPAKLKYTNNCVKNNLSYLPSGCARRRWLVELEEEGRACHGLPFNKLHLLKVNFQQQACSLCIL